MKKINGNSKYHKILTKKFLYKEYIVNKKSCQQIANEVGCNKTNIRDYLKKYNIPRRTHSEALKGKFMGKQASQFKGGSSSKIYYCKDCGKKISRCSGVYGSGRCGSCNKIELCKNPENTPNWHGGISFEPYPLKFDKELKASIRQRDNYICQVCGKLEVELKGFNKKLDVHHIDYDKDNLDPENLTSLCRSCHIKTNGNRDYWKEYFKNKIKVFA